MRSQLEEEGTQEQEGAREEREWGEAQRGRGRGEGERAEEERGRGIEPVGQREVTTFTEKALWQWAIKAMLYITIK